MGICVCEVFRAAIKLLCVSDSERGNRVYLPEGRDCNLIKEMVGVLKLFVTILMSGSSYPTVGSLLHKLFNNTLARMTVSS